MPFGISRARPPAAIPGTPVTGPANFTAGGWTGGSAHLSGDGTLAVDPPLPPWPASAATDYTTLSLPAAWRCSQMICNGIGILDLYATHEVEGELHRQQPNPPLCADPWPLISPMNWKVQIVLSLLLRGNAYCFQTDPDPANGYPRQLPIIATEQVHCEVVDGMPIYWINGDGPYGPLDILHFHGPMMTGDPCGMGVVEVHRRGLGFAMDIDTYGSATFAHGAVPPIILHVNRPELTREQALDIQERWMIAHGYGNRSPAVLPSTITTETVAFSPQDAEYLNSRVQSAVEVCWMFGIDPRVLALQAGQGSLTYANLEMAQAELARDSFMPWTTRIEQVLSKVMPRRTAARFDFVPMMRPTMIDRYTAYEIGLRAGFLTMDEVRYSEDLPPLEAADRPGRGKDVRPLTTVPAPSEVAQ